MKSVYITDKAKTSARGTEGALKFTQCIFAPSVYAVPYTIATEMGTLSDTFDAFIIEFRAFR